MYIAYMDDCGSTGRNLADKSAPFQIVGALIVNTDAFEISEVVLSSIIDDHVPEELRDGFEFHAADMWAANKPFEALTKTQSLEILENCVVVLEGLTLPYVYGAVDKKKLSEQLYATADPIDMAFRLCAEQVESWMATNAAMDLAVLIFDDTENKSQKAAIRNAFRQYRRRVRSIQHNRGKLRHFVDDMFFGTSADSLGIQMVDVCNFIFSRHLQGKEDTEHLYRALFPRIVGGAIEPK